MYLKNLVALLALAAATEAAVPHRRSPFTRALQKRQGNRFGGGGGFGGNNGQNNGGNQNGGQNNGGDQNGGNNGGDQNNGGNGGGAQLDANLIQTGSQQDGNNPGAAEQATSATDNQNFINFCQGAQLTNGEQVEGGSCNGIPMGKIPAKNNMPSTVFVNPQNGGNVQANQDFDIQIQMINFAPGSFTNATTTYYSAPQDLNGAGQIIGHTHITVQDTGNDLNPTQPLDPTIFAFFKGVNDAGNGQGLLAATVEGGLPDGNYRACTMAAAANHQPVLMPVAQRGAQDDCVRFTVGGNGGGGNGGDQGQNNGGNNGGDQGQNNGGNNGGDQGQNNGGNNGGDQGQNNGGDQGQNNGGNNGGDQAQNNGGNGGNGGGNGGFGANNVAGVAAPEIGDSGNPDRPFSVNGDTFVNREAAVQRACDAQNNGCSDAVNNGQANGVTLQDCNNQVAQCVASL
jgi:transcription initiation factor TFIID subunit 15